MHLGEGILLLLGLSAFCAGFVDTIAGGGGLIALPALLATGMPPSLALGTNKLQSSCGSLMATVRFAQKGHIHLRQALLGIVCCLIGATVGTLSILAIHNEWLKKVLPFLLLLVLLYSILSPRITAKARHANSILPPHIHSLPSKTKGLSIRWFFIIFGLLLGFYDGFLGPGTGSFWVVALMFFLNFDMQKATMHAKVYNFTSNIVALVWFVQAGQVMYEAGIAMAIGQLLGAYLAAHLVMTKGIKLIRPVFITMVSVMLISLAKQYWFS